MRILYIHQYFASINGKSGTRSYEFSRRWSDSGHQVVMLTTTANLGKEELESASGILFKRFFLDGISICAVNIHYKQNMSFGHRCLAFILFSLAAAIYVLICKKPQIVYATSTPLTVGIPALFGKWIRGIPFVFEVRDQWPEIPIEMGFIQNKYVCRMLICLERLIYCDSAAIIALSEGIKKNICTMLNNKKIFVFPNCADLELFSPSVNGSAIREKYGWEGKIVFLHPGAVGRVNNLEFIIDAAERMNGDKNALFVLLGEGSEKDRLQTAIKTKSLKNIEILPAVQKHRVPEFIAACDIGMVIIGNHEILQNNSANKFFDILSSGKPVLLNYSGWQRDVIDTWNAGIGCRLCDLNEFIQAVRRLSSDGPLRRQMGVNSRMLAQRKYNRDTIAPSVLDILANHLMP